jgi:hypothetical protein
MIMLNEENPHLNEDNGCTASATLTLLRVLGHANLAG